MTHAELAQKLNQLSPAEIREKGLPKELSEALRAYFPMLQAKSNGQPYVYFNNAATALKPEAVLNAMDDYYRHYGVNVFRGVDALGFKATEAYEGCHERVEAFIDAPPKSVVLTRGTTSALNLVCLALERAGAKFGIEAGRNIVTSVAEHHANFLPWQQLCKRQGMELRFAPINADGVVTPEALASVLDEKTSLVALNQISNVLAGENDIPTLAKMAHDKGALFVCDGAQGIVHRRPSMRKFDCDFYAFSGHKLYGPTGIGCLYGRPEILKELDPVEYGGEMIDTVGLYDMTPADPPTRFEAGTPMIAEAIGLVAALDFLEPLNEAVLQAQKAFLGRRILAGLKTIPEIRVYNEAGAEHGLITFNREGAHAHDVASVFDRAGISLRAGQHCAQPMMDWLQCVATLRVSLSFYNTAEEVDLFLAKAKESDAYLDIFF